MLNDTLLSTRSRAKLLGLMLAGAVAPLATIANAYAQDDVKPANIRRPLDLFVGGLDERGTPGEDVNSDVLMLARVDLQATTVRVVSIPRDLYVEIPGFGYDKITRANDFGSKATGTFKGGAQAIKDTIAVNFGIELDGVVLTTFDGFVQIVDALGGIDIENPYDLYDGEYPTLDYGYKEIYYPAGWLHLSGEEALELARTRHQDGDDGRVMRQQLIIRGLLERARDPEIAPLLPEIVFENKSAIRTDLGPSKRLALALAAPEFSNDNVTFTNLNAYVFPDSAPNGMWIYSGDWSQIPGFVQGFLDGAF